MAAWLHKNKPAAWRGRGKHWGPKGPRFWQRHPPMGGWLAGGTRPWSLHPRWIVRIAGRSVGRPCPGRLAFFPNPPRPCSLSLLFGWPSRSAHVLSVGPPFQRIRHLLISGSARRRRVLNFSGSFHPSGPVSNRPHVPYQVWLIRRAKGGNVLEVGYGGLMWVWVGDARATRATVPNRADPWS